MKDASVPIAVSETPLVIVKGPLIWDAPDVTVKESPVSRRSPVHCTLRTVVLPDEWMMVTLLATLITTSSLAVGTMPVLQLVAVFQSPLAPVQETVAASAENRPVITNSTQQNFAAVDVCRLRTDLLF